MRAWTMSVVVLCALGACTDAEDGDDGGVTVDASSATVGDAAFADGALPSTSGTDGGGQPPVQTQVDGGAPPQGDAGGGPNEAGAPPVSTGGDAPVIPPIMGDCPEFKTGTATIGGLSGINLQVGPKQSGTGSLIFYWHGTGSFAGEVNSMIPQATRSEILAQGGIIVSPQSSLGTGGDCSGTSTFSKDDFKVADLIAACAVRDHGIDPRRIYTTGCSAGGLQAGCMASLRSSYIAAAVPNSGGITFPQMIQDTKHIPSLMTMHGGSSDMVIVQFSETSKRLDDQFKQAGGLVVNCDHGGGHCRAPAELYSAGWDFMKTHPFGVSPDPFAGGIPGSYPSYCKVH